jgi:hypothetical protein
MTYESITSRNLSEGYPMILSYVNEVTGGWFMNMILIGIYIIAVMGVNFYRRDLIEGIMAGGFLLFLVTFFFWIADAVSGFVFAIVIAIAIAGFVLGWFVKKGA